MRCAISRFTPALLLGTCSFALITACGESGPTGPELTPEIRQALASITANDLGARVGVIAHDSMAGRGTPSVGLDMTAAFVAEVFQSAGLRPGGEDGFFQRFPLQGGSETTNTIGWIEGSDPAFRSEYIVFSAHMDHLGVGFPVQGDTIYNGADDNASGTAAILELAEAFGRFGVLPLRSIVFITFSAEELGLVGSRWYVDHPTFPLENTFANVNLDMIGRNWRDTIVALRSPDELGEMAERIADDHAELGLEVIDDPWPNLSLISRSDQWSFIRNGVPALFFTSGLHTDYHTPLDEADRLDYEKTERVTRLLFLLALELAGYQ
jgi:hypothetical protein